MRDIKIVERLRPIFSTLPNLRRVAFVPLRGRRRGRLRGRYYPRRPKISVADGVIH